MARVAVGDFDAMIAVGITDVLAASRADVVHAPTATMLDYLHGCLPTLVVLDSSGPGADEVVRRIVIELPSVQVVTCSAGSQTLRVYPSFHGGEWFECPLSELRRQISG